MKNFLFITILVLGNLTCLAQGEANNWFFGNGAGLVFNNLIGTVTASAAAAGTINTAEGCSSISDVNGNLLFYTDGRNVWDRNHQIMPNGNYNNGTGLLGDPSSTSSALIVPRPGNLDQFYVFTVDEPHHNNAWAYPNQGPANASGNSIGSYSEGQGFTVPGADDGFNNGLNYSLVDLTLNAGNGDLDGNEKNVHLITYDPNDSEEPKFKCSEKITAVEHADGQSYWLITQFKDSFYAFRIDASGVNTTPVISVTSPLIPTNGYRRNAIGYLKSSPDGSKIVAAHNQNGNILGQTEFNSGSAWLYDFDDSTGVVSNPLELSAGISFYGVEFSQDSKVVYLSGGNAVRQYDLQAASISTSEIIVQNSSGFLGALQLGPDGKIYVCNSSNSQALDVILSPNTLGTGCNYQVSGQALSAGTFASLGLPPFIQSFLVANIQYDNDCLGQTTQFSISSSETILSISWDFGDGQISSATNPSNTYAAAGNYTVSVTITTPTETKSFSTELTIYETPVANNPGVLNICDNDNDGQAALDLNTLVSPSVLGSQSAADFEVLYFSSQADADSGNSPISMPFTNTANPQQIFVRIQNALNADCFDTTSFTVQVFDTPVANTVADLPFCDDGLDGSLTNGQMEVDLSAATPAVLGSQSPTDFAVSYHTSQANADSGTGALPLSYYNTTPFAQTIFVRIENVLNVNCFDTTTFTIEVFPTPTANTPSNINACDDDNNGVLDFDFDILVSPSVLGSQSAADFEVLYFSSQADADSGNSPISMPFTNTANPQQIFVRIQNALNADCFDTTSFTVQVFDTPVANTVADLPFCDDGLDGSLTNGQMEVDLSAATPAVLGSQSPTDFAVSYHTSQANADAGTGALPLTYYNATPFAQTIFVRIENMFNVNCFDTTSFVVEVNPIPNSFNSSLFQCDEDGFVDGFTVFNCHEADEILTGNLAGLSTAFFITLADAQSGVNPINGYNFPNTSNPQIVYARVIDDNTGCFSISELDLEVSTTDVSNAMLVRCDDDGTEDGLASFDLSLADSMVLVGVPTGVTITYYPSNQDALLEQNPLVSPFTNTSPYSQIVYARAEDDNACYGISQLLLKVNPLPILDQDQSLIYCLDTYPSTISLNAGVVGGTTGLTFQWSNGETSQNIQVNQAGVYTITVQNSNGCSQSRQITVVDSEIATISNIAVTDASEFNSIAVSVSGDGDYEFSLDNPLGPYQDLGSFQDVLPGLHTVYVRDKNGCGITQEMVSVIGFMKFFTPNDDGFNDTWQIIGVSAQFQPDSKVFIYDRYGKLITQISPLQGGWNGKYNGYNMPASDYWFHATLQDGRVFKGHFSLVR